MDGARGKDWLRARGASPVSYRHNFLVFYFLLIFNIVCFPIFLLLLFSAFR